MRVSVIIINYNYARFLREAIVSSLEQSYHDIETIVVDDGSTDNSKEIIGEFNGEVVSLFQENAGMMQAVNNAFGRSRGDIVLFLDADDYLVKDCVSRVVDNWIDGTSKVHYRLRKIDGSGNPIGVFPPRHQNLSEGEVWKEIMEKGRYTTPPTSGNAFSRAVLEQILPVHDARVGHGGDYNDFIPADAYLKMRVPFYGPIVAIDDVLGVYRIHGANQGAEKNPYMHREKRQRLLRLAKKNSEFIRSQATGLGVSWDEDVLFTYTKYLKLRVLSLRFDGACHPWPNDTRVGLLMKAWRNLNEDFQNNTARRLYDFVVVGVLCTLPYAYSRKFLKAIHQWR